MQVFTSKIALEAKTDCDYNRLQSWMKKGAQSMECTKKKKDPADNNSNNGSIAVLCTNCLCKCKYAKDSIS